MKYMGSKNRLAKHILPFITQGRTDFNWVEPFAGGMNMTDKVTTSGTVLANEYNPYIVAMFKALRDGWVPDEYYTREQYQTFKDGVGADYEIGYVGINCSYRGIWFAGFAGRVQTREGLRDYQDEARRNVLKQSTKLSNVIFTSGDYRNVYIQTGDIVYCDPPYINTADYNSDFNHDSFWQGARETSEYAEVYVSEYTAPDDMLTLYSKPVRSSISASGTSGGSRVSTEKLFTFI